MAGYESRIYWNTGLPEAKANHWLRLSFTGISDARLIGSRIEARSSNTGQLLGTRWIHNNHAYKSGSALDAHFGLGQSDQVDIHVIALDGGERVFEKVAIDTVQELDLNS